jgi:predicted phosphodiesterase
MLQKFRRCFGRTGISQTTTSISAPFNAQVLHEMQCPDDPARDYFTKLRHTVGPGFQFMSDLHCERTLDGKTYSLPDFRKSAPNLILAGDIGRLCDYSALLSLLRWLCAEYERVIFIPGNHEFYGTSREHGLSLARSLCQELGDKFVFMDQAQLMVEDTIVLGCILYSFIPTGVGLTNDFAQIDDWTVADHNKNHFHDISWLREKLRVIAESYPGKRVIIVTHYAPTFLEANHPSRHSSHYRYCFSSATLEIFKDWEGAGQVTHWIFGHTHYNTVFSCNDTIVASNQPNDSSCLRKFDPEATI